jgi:L-amino acid N-acyltransferase YncA
MLVRHADPARDVRACATIYAPFVHDTPVSFEERPPPSKVEIARRIAAVSEGYPWLVAEIAGEIAGTPTPVPTATALPTAGRPTSRSTWGRGDAVRGWDAPSTAS